MKKTRRFLLALLPMAVALIFASCGSSDEVAEPTPADGGTKTVPVKITVGMDDATRATVGSDNSTLYFHTADKLAVLSGGSCIALLENTTIAEGSSSATFQGNMTVPSDVSSYGEVTVVLISNENIGVQTTTDYSWVNNGPAICVANGSSSALNEAVKKYSYLTGTGPFSPAGSNNYTLTQHTAFLNVAVTFKDGTAADENLSVTVTNNSSTIGTGSVTTEADATSSDVVAKFVVPVAAGTTMNGATITFTDKDPITLSSTATLEGKSYKIEKVIGEHEGVQLWEGGPYWATMNVGATSETDYGLYYAWGETTGYGSDVSDGHYFNWADNNGTPVYRYANGSNSTLTKYCQNSSYGYNGFIDNLTTLEAEDDAATANWGSPWRMPTFNELKTLINADNSDKVTSEWVSNYKGTGVAGRIFTGAESGYTNHSIFLPAAGNRFNSDFLRQNTYGQYWSSSLWESDRYSDARAPYFNSDGTYIQGGGRYMGYSVRPVHD